MTGLNPLRFLRIWRVLGFFFLFAVVTGSLVPVSMSIDIGYEDKIIHILVYLLMMLWFGQTYPRQYRKVIGVALLALGLMIELLQGETTYRSFEWGDLGADFTGVGIGMLLLSTPIGTWLYKFDQWFATQVSS